MIHNILTIISGILNTVLNPFRRSTIFFLFSPKKFLCSCDKGNPILDKNLLSSKITKAFPISKKP